MAKEFAKGFYDSIAWHKCRQSFIDKRRMIDGGMCQRCGERLGYIVHHKIELTQDNIDDTYVSLSHDNMEYVCHECHNEIHNVWQSKSRVMFDEAGNVLPR